MPKKNVTFHLEFSSEIIQNARYEMQTLHSLENLRIANEVLGRFLKIISDYLKIIQITV